MKANLDRCEKSRPCLDSNNFATECSHMAVLILRISRAYRIIMRTQKEINNCAKIIESEAKVYVANNEVLQATIMLHCRNSDKSKLFDYCVSHCKPPNGHLVISYILNAQFLSSSARADFANRHDADFNTFHHHAAIQNHPDLMDVFNEERRIGNESKRIRFVLENNKQQTPLDICCQLGNKEIICFSLKTAAQLLILSSRGLTAGSMSEQSDHQLGEYIHYRWIPWSSHGMTESGGLTAVFRIK